MADQNGGDRDALQPKAEPTEVSSNHPSSDLDVRTSDLVKPIPREKATMPLEFEGLSFMGSGGDLHLRNIGKNQRKALENYLADTYGAVYADFHRFYMVLNFKSADDIPPRDQRPFSIAGYIVLWAEAGHLPVFPVLGDLAEGDTVAIDAEILARLRPFELPAVDVLQYLGNVVFPDCEAISFIGDGLVIELPEAPTEQYAQSLKNYPRYVDRSSIGLEYHNGPLARTAVRRRGVAPDALVVDDLQADETDYVQKDGAFHPGAMLSSLDAEGHIVCSVSAGVLVEKEGRQRLTAPFHAWEEHDKRHPGLLGQDTEEARRVFRVAQGGSGNHDGKPGTTVGFLRERLPNSDIGLVQLERGVAFKNGMAGGEGVRPKKLLSLQDLNELDEYQFASFVTGTQMLRCIGLRAAFERRRGGAAHPHLLPPDSHAYVSCAQGVFATNEPALKGQPNIRASVCGSVLLRRKKRHTNDQPEHLLERGEVCAMMPYADMQLLYGTANDLLIYADAMDALVEDGWTVSQPD
ncbi:hypothetical protein SPI_09434 [Niveomyces insectorum RCEF 264]|uniref:Uncharacterized protein n=1 Tax=Niveomyces insectorum RCEF 264 TaxID=1081102 RepID=A0A167LU82_9HYPO|nr:hypothetical protein SPI_09434 [Niveomyces insectorum RCEF 264]